MHSLTITQVSLSFSREKKKKGLSCLFPPVPLPTPPNPTTNCTFPTEPAANPRRPVRAGLGWINTRHLTVLSLRWLSRSRSASAGRGWDLDGAAPRTRVPGLSRRARRGGAGRGTGDRRTKRLFPSPLKTFFIKLLLYSNPTSFWPRKAFVQVEDDFLHKVLYVTVFRTAHEHHPVVGEALHSGFFPHLGAVPQLQLHLHGTLRTAGETALNNRKATVRHCTLRLTFFFLLLETHIKGNGGALRIHVSRAWARTAHTPKYPTGRRGPGAPGPASTLVWIVTECYPQLGRGSEGRGKRESTLSHYEHDNKCIANKLEDN